MKIVIDIPEELYNLICKDYNVSYSCPAYLGSIIKKGVVLPKGHGKFIDVDVLLKNIHTHTVFDEDGYGESFDYVLTDDIYNAQDIMELNVSGDGWVDDVVKRMSDKTLKVSSVNPDEYEPLLETNKEET